MREKNFAVCFAVKEEAAAFLRSLEKVRTLWIKGSLYWIGQLPGGSRRCIVFLTGIGRFVSDRNVRAFFAEFEPELLIVSGTAGAVRDELRVGDILVADNVGSESDVKSIMQAVGKNAQPAVFRGILQTVEQVITSAEDKRAIARGTEIYAIDMESSAVARVAKENACPVVCVRTISDAAGETLPVNFNQFLDADGRMRIPALAVYLLLRPAKLIGAIRFGARVSHATAGLAGTLVRILGSLAGRTV